MEQDSLYEVKCIVDSKELRGKVFYKVRWSGYDSDEDTWEPESSLVNCKVHLETYLRKQASLKDTSFSGDERSTPKLSQKKKRSRPYCKSIQRHNNKESYSTENKRGLHKYHLSTLDLTPSTYNLRRSTITQRPPLHSSYISSDDEEAVSNVISSPNEGLGRRELHIVDIKHQDKEQPPMKPIVASSPSWMQLGLAEMIFCLLFLAIVLAMFWFLQNTLNTTTSK